MISIWFKRSLSLLLAIILLASVQRPGLRAYSQQRWVDLELSNYYPRVYPGESISINAVVTHLGGAPKWVVKLYVSSPLPVGVAVAITPSEGVLDYVGDKMTSQVTFDVAPSVKPGVYRVNLTADAIWPPEEEYGEAGESGTKWRYRITVSFPLIVMARPADLHVSMLVAIPSAPRVGDKVYFTATIANIGEGDAGPSTVAFLVDGKLHAAISIRPIPAGGSINVTAPPWTAVLGNHTITCVADYFDQVPEGYYEGGEFNNELTIFLEVFERPSFKLNITPAERTVMAGNSTTFVIEATSLGGFDGWVNLTVRISPSDGKVRLELKPTRIRVAPKGKTVVDQFRAELKATTNEKAFGNYTITVEGEGIDVPTGIKAEDSANCTLQVVSVGIEEVKAFYKLNSFFLDMSGLVKPNKYYVRVKGEVDRVEFVVNKRVAVGKKVVIGGKEWYVSPEYDMGAVRTNLLIRVVGERGDAFRKVIKTNVYRTPTWLKAFILEARVKGQLHSDVKGKGDFDHTWILEFKVKYPPDELPGSLELDRRKLFGGSYGFKLPAEVSATLTSERKAEIGGGGKYEIKVSDAKAGIKAGIYGTIVITDRISLSHLTLRVGGSVEIPIFKYGKVFKIWIIKVGVEIGVAIFGEADYEYIVIPVEGMGNLMPGFSWKESSASYTLGLKAWATAAIIVLSLKAEGWGKITFKVYVPRPYWRKDSLILNVGVTVTLEHWFGSYTLLKIERTYPSHEIVKTTGWLWIPRTWAVEPYSEYRWVPGAEEGLYLWNVYISTRPYLAHDGRNTIVVWMHDDVSKPYLKGYEIYYALWNATEKAWTRPRPITNNTLIDGDPAVTFLPDGRAIAAWATIMREVTNETDPLSVMPYSETRYSVWEPETGRWSKPARLTNNSVFEAFLELSAGGGTPVLAWIADEDANLSTMDDISIYASMWNGDGWTAPARIARGILVVPRIAVSSLGDKAIIVWAQHTDGNLSTLGDIELFYSAFEGGSWSSPIRLTRNYVEDSSPSLAARGGRIALAWIEKSANDTLKLSWLQDGGFENPLSIVTRPKISSVDLEINRRGEPVILWHDGMLQRPFYTAFVAVDGAWTRPEPLTTTPLYQRDFDMGLTDDGKIIGMGVAYNSTEMRAGLYSIMRSYIVNKPPRASFSYSPDRPLVGEEVTFEDRSVDPEGFLAAWNWSFGDGTWSSERNPTHVFRKEGRYTVTLTVSDEMGLRSSHTREVEVYRRANISVRGPGGWIGMGDKVTIEGTLDPPLEGAAIKIIVVSPTGKRAEAIVRTGKMGEFAYTLIPREMGSWRVQTVFEGADYLLPGQSETMVLNVGPPLYLVALIILALALISVLVLRRARGRKDRRSGAQQANRSGIEAR